MARKSRKTLVLSEKSWHVKWYRFWQRYGHLKVNAYKENLCHYWRCVLIWAPWRAFISYPLFGRDWATPITAAFVTLGFLAVGGLTTLLVLWPWDTLAVIGVGVGIAGIGAGVAAGSVWIDDHPQQSKAWAKKYLWSWFKYVALPFAWLGKKIGYGIVWILGSIAEWAEPETWAKIGVTAFISIASIAIVGSLIAAFIADWATSLITLTVVGVVIGLAVATFFAYQHRKMTEQAVDKGPGFGRVSYEYLASGKHRICPFIEIDK